MKYILFAALVMATAEAEPLRITVYNSANVSSGDMDSMVDQLRRIFRQSGLEIQWADGIATAEEASLMLYSPAPRKGQERLNLCRARRDIALQIVGQAPPGLKKSILGMALPLAPAGLNVRVFDDRVQEAARNNNREHSTMLAHVTAHEIGHVLLRSGAHTGAGLMTNVWSEREYGWMASGALFFTAVQSTAMRATLAGSGCPASLADRRSGTGPALPETPGRIAEIP